MRTEVRIYLVRLSITVTNDMSLKKKSLREEHDFRILVHCWLALLFLGLCPGGNIMEEHGRLKLLRSLQLGSSEKEEQAGNKEYSIKACYTHRGSPHTRPYFPLPTTFPISLSICISINRSVQ